MATKLKLNQVVAVEKGIKNRTCDVTSKIYKDLQKPDLFTGMERTYQPLKDDGERFPDESKRVQMRVEDQLDAIVETTAELWNISAQRDYANTIAKADVKVDDTTILANVPAPYLLFLEKQLNDMKAEIDKMPELSSAHDWTYDKGTRMYRGKINRTVKTKKVDRVVVKLPQTEHQQGQAEIVYEDVTIGHWDNTALSAAMSSERKKALQRRVIALIKAVKFAREEANNVTAEEQNVAKSIFDYLLAE